MAKKQLMSVNHFYKVDNKKFKEIKIPTIASVNVPVPV